jgi:hypothetical protein
MFQLLQLQASHLRNDRSQGDLRGESPGGEAGTLDVLLNM